MGNHWYAKGREILSMIITNFKTISHVAVMYNAHHLRVLQYPGEPKPSTVSGWGFCAANAPSDTTGKQHYTLMRTDLNMYDNKDEYDPEKSLQIDEYDEKTH